MYELKEQVGKIINQVNQDWVNAIKEAEKSGTGLELNDMFGKFSQNIQSLNQKFMEFEQRSSKKKGWGK